MLHKKQYTRTAEDRAGEGPRDPLNNKINTISQFLNSFRITFHVEFRHDDISQLDPNVFHIPPLFPNIITIVAQIDSSRLSELALTYACIDYL